MPKCFSLEIELTKLSALKIVELDEIEYPTLHDETFRKSLPNWVIINNKIKSINISIYIKTKKEGIKKKIEKNFGKTYLSLSTMLRIVGGEQAIKYRTISLWPCLAAKCKAVCPLASIESRE